MKRLKKICKYFIIGGLCLFLIFTIGGIIIKRNGQSKINREQLIAEGGKLALDTNGRKIEYFTYGSNDPNTPVIINIHGSGLDATFEKLIHQKSCEELNVRGISISLPGCGNTDLKIGRKVIEWASEDLYAVLEQENIDHFMISGHSQGTPHAMAAAFFYGERCTALGLNAPLLPNNLTQELNIEGALGHDQFKTTEQLKHPLNAWMFFTFYITTDLFSPSLPVKTLVYSCDNMEQDTALIRMLSCSVERCVKRGSAGICWESAKDVCYDWGFDPRLIKTKNISIWHASDDNLCPPVIGQWLANYYTSQGSNVQFKNENIGYGHMTYCSSHYQKTENSMVQSLLLTQQIHQ